MVQANSRPFDFVNRLAGEPFSTLKMTMLGKNAIYTTYFHQHDLHHCRDVACYVSRCDLFDDRRSVQPHSTCKPQVRLHIPK